MSAKPLLSHVGAMAELYAGGCLRFNDQAKRRPALK
jgi:hypothetical protein